MEIKRLKFMDGSVHREVIRFTGEPYELARYIDRVKERAVKDLQFFIPVAKEDGTGDYHQEVRLTGERADISKFFDTLKYIALDQAVDMKISGLNSNGTFPLDMCAVKTVYKIDGGKSSCIDMPNRLTDGVGITDITGEVWVEMLGDYLGRVANADRNGAGWSVIHAANIKRLVRFGMLIDFTFHENGDAPSVNFAFPTVGGYIRFSCLRRGWADEKELANNLNSCFEYVQNLFADLQEAYIYGIKRAAGLAATENKTFDLLHEKYQKIDLHLTDASRSGILNDTEIPEKVKAAFRDYWATHTKIYDVFEMYRFRYEEIPGRARFGIAVPCDGKAEILPEFSDYIENGKIVFAGNIYVSDCDDEILRRFMVAHSRKVAEMPERETKGLLHCLVNNY
jgi:hypothetical protein